MHPPYLSTLQKYNYKLYKPSFIKPPTLSLKWSTFKILDTLKWPNIYQLICIESLKFFHRIIFENSPIAIVRLLYISNERSEVARSCRVPRTKIFTKSEFLKRSIILKAVHLYSLLPDNLRVLNPKKLNKAIFEYIRPNWEPFVIPKMQK